MTRFLGLAMATLALGLAPAGCGDDADEGGPSTPEPAPATGTLEQAQAGVEAAGYQVRPAKQADLITFMTKGEPIVAEEGFVATGKGQTIETFALIYADAAETEKVVADKRKAGVFSVGEQDGVVYLAPDERTLNGIMNAAAGG